MNISLDKIVKEMLGRYATKHEIAVANQLISELRKRVADLEANQITLEKEFYTLKDLEKVLPYCADTIRKKYVQTGIIDAYKPPGSRGWIVSKKEYKRIVEIVSQRGTWALSA